MQILFFTSPSCNWCPYMEKILDKIVEGCSYLELKKIDITQEIELAEKHDVVALPTIILPSGQRIIGGADEGFITRQIEIFCLTGK